MRFNRLTILCAFLSVFAWLAYSQNEGKLDQFQEELEERDWDALRQYLRTRREDVKAESESALLISGDVRGDWRNKHEVFRNESLLGGDETDFAGVRRGRNRFDIEANLRLDYDLEKSWAVLQFQYDNKAGIDDEVSCREPDFRNRPTLYCREMFGSGVCGNLCLKQAFFGYNLYKCGDTEIDIEIGRRNLYHVFDSKVQFLSRFDGILLNLAGTKKHVLDYFIRVAGFVVDFKVNHFAWVTELGALDLFDKGIDLKYSFIDWRKNGVNRCSKKIVLAPNKNDHRCKVECGENLPLGTRFLVSQWSAAYEIKKDSTCFKDYAWLNKPMRFFGAFLYNHDNPTPKCFKPGQNKAWYAGYRIGEVKKENDWAFQVMYQWVEAFSVPDLDMSGIGNGNVLDGLIISDGFGNTNFKGWRFDGLYAFTDEISINARCEWSTDITNHLFKRGGCCDHSANRFSHYYRQIKVEMIYAF